MLIKRGSGYNSSPTIVVNGNGNYAKLSPVIENGQLKEVKVLNGGIGYTNEVILTVVSSGSQARLFANIQNWTINLFSKHFNTIKSDDGFVTLSDRSDYGLQYCHLYAPRNLRKNVFAKKQGGENEKPEDLILYGVNDLIINDNQETESEYHSPIIGWAYDGNPIYGRYGYSTPEGGTAKIMKSGYESVSKSNRPSITNFPLGSFNEDFEFKGNGDLDEHNGRFGITPEYPNGTYAYFATINDTSNDTGGPLKDLEDLHIHTLLDHLTILNPYHLTSKNRQIKTNMI